MKKVKMEAAFICPVTRKHVSSDEVYFSRGVCHSCGHLKAGSITHATKLAGYWVKPSLLEYIQGKRKFFVTTSEISCD